MSAEEAWQDSPCTFFTDPKEAFMAGYRRALEDAADELDADKLIAHWGGSAAIRLRARAAAADPTERKGLPWYPEADGYEP